MHDKKNGSTRSQTGAANRIPIWLARCYLPSRPGR